MRVMYIKVSKSGELWETHKIVKDESGKVFTTCGILSRTRDEAVEWMQKWVNSGLRYHADSFMNIEEDTYYGPFRSDI